MQRTGVEMPVAFPAVIVAIRQFLLTPIKIETDAALSWSPGGPWGAPVLNLSHGNGNPDG